ncbi:MAG: hypothetical protein ACTSR8_03085 [Promethearchaeota archaeon]
MHSNNKMQGKFSIVTGAISGIGKVAALGLARKRANVIMICRNMEHHHQIILKIILVSLLKRENKENPRKILIMRY